MLAKLIIFSAPSGSGKSTIINYLLEQNLNLAFLVLLPVVRHAEQNSMEWSTSFFLPKNSVPALPMTSFWNMKKCIKTVTTVH